MTRMRWLAVILLLAFGALRQPVDEAIGSSLERNRFREAQLLPDGSMRQQLGQMGAAAALGGFRSFLATLYELRAITAYSDVDYEAVERNYHLATRLQPREPGYWDTAAWMLDSNARRYYKTFDEEHSELEREILADLAVDRGKKFLDDGLLYNPDDYILNRSLGNHYAYRRESFCEAAESFKRAGDLMDGPSAAARHHAIYLALCPGREREAYLKLRVIADRIRAGESPIPSDLMPGSLPMHMRYLENVLQVPPDERFQIQFDFAWLYQRLRARLGPGISREELRALPKLHRTRLQRLEEILEIPRVRRIPF